jgi:cysteinyl-tRNA synthetase
MAKYWIHNGMLLVNGQKMSKSLGNIISLDDILRQQDGEVVRYVMLSSHYQKTLDWTDELAASAKQSLNRLYGALKTGDSEAADEADENHDNPVLDALCGNLNTPLALHTLHEIADKIFKSTDKKEINRLCSQLKNGSELLGFLSKEPNEWFKKNNGLISEEEIERLIAERSKAKSDKDFKSADEIRQKLLEKNIRIEDTVAGTVWRSIT